MASEIAKLDKAKKLQEKWVDRYIDILKIQSCSVQEKWVRIKEIFQGK